MGELLHLPRSPLDFHRSTSQRRRYRRCGYEYLLYYLYGWRTIHTKGSYVFGDVMERLATLVAVRWVTDQATAAQLFVEAWGLVNPDHYDWSTTRTYELFRNRGPALAALLVSEIPAWVMPDVPVWVQEEIRFYLAPGVREIAKPDLYSLVRVPGANGSLMPQLPAPTILDFKTSDRPYPPLSVELDEQLTDYQLAMEVGMRRPVEQVGLCVMIYQERPRVQWLFSPRRPPAVIERFRSTAIAIDGAIKAEIFYQNDRSCFTMGTCDYVPICYAGAAEEREKKLVRLQADDTFTGWDDDDVED